MTETSSRTLAGVLAAAGRPLASIGERVEFTPREYVIRQGTTVGHVFLVDEGVFRAEIPDRHGQPLEVARFGRGDYFGEMAFLQGEPASASVRAVTHAAAWRIPHATLSGVADEHPEVMAVLASGLAARLTATNERFRDVRPGRLVACLGEAPEAAIFLGHVLQSATRHLRRPVVVFDLSSGARLLPGVALPAVDELLAVSRPVDHLVELACGAADGVFVSSGEAAQAASTGLLSLASGLRRWAGLVVIFGGERLAPVLPEIEDLDIAVRLQYDGDTPAGLAASLPTIRLRGDGKLVPPGAVQALRFLRGANLLRSVPECEPLGGAHPPGATNEPWSSVDWTARHLAGLKVGLALGAGTAKAYAHIGVVEELRRLGVPIDYVAGANLGAAVANAVAWGTDMQPVQQMFDRSFTKALRFTFPFHSFFTPTILRRDLHLYNRRLKFEHLPIPLSVITVDLNRREEVILRSGFVAPALIASMAVPGLYPPLRLDGRTLVDGGLLNPVPVRAVAEAGADVVIGVKLTSVSEQVQRTAGVRKRRFWLAPPIIDTIQQSFELMQWRIVGQGQLPGDIMIEPRFSGPAGLRDFGRGTEFVALGREAVAEMADTLRRQLPWIGS